MISLISANFITTYVAPVLITLALAALFAFLLSFLGQKLRVKRDERIDKIRENLSGANCGGCGFAGCDAFAEALFKGETTLSACSPTSKQGKVAIAAILGVSDAGDAPRMPVVKCNGGDDCFDKAGYRGYGDCQSANLMAGGTKVCEQGCMGLSSCAGECHYDAITVDKDSGVAVVNTRNCTSCGVCIKACPKGIIEYMPVANKVYVACSNRCAGRQAAAQCKKSCIACGLCAKVCPHGAIKVVDNLAEIDYNKCTSCGLCVEKCPRKCILTR